MPTQSFFQRNVLLLLFFLTVSSFSQNNFKTSKLQNGLTYYIHNHHDTDKNYLYLVLKVGSVNEDETQKGYAHFLEHIAFKGGKRFTEKTYVDILKENGFELGTHFNAQTNYEYTVYKIILPKNSNPKLNDKTFDFFSDIIENLNFNPYDIETEKKIVLQEMKAYPQNDSLFNFKLGNSLYKERNPIGNEKSILNIDREKIRKFHQKWYAANNAAVILVGDFDIKKTESQIKKHFSEIKKQAQLNKQSLYSSLAENEIKIIKGKSDKVYLTIAQPVQNFSKKRNEIRSAFRKILENRIKEKRSSKISSLWISGSFFLSDVYYTSISFENDKNTEENIHEILSEIKRLSEENISQEELNFNQKFKVELPTHHKTALVLTEIYADAFLGQNSTDNKIFKVSPSDIQKEAKILLKNGKIRVLIESSEADTLNRKITLPKNSVKKTPNFHYKYFSKKEEEKEETINIPKLKSGKAQNFISKKYFKKLNLTELKYANGMKVYLKPFKNNESQIRIWGFAEGGTSHLPDQIYYRYESSVPYVELGGFGSLTPQQSSELLYQKEVGIIFSISEFYRDIFTSVKSENTEDLFKILHLKMTRQHGNKNEFEKIIQEEIRNVDTVKSDNLLSVAEMIAMAKNDYFPQRIAAKTIEQFQSLNLPEMEQFYHQSFAQANGWNMFITGDFEIEKIIPLVNQYFGNIPKGKPFPKNKKLSSQNKVAIQIKTPATQDRIYLHQIYQKKYTPSLKNHLIIKILEKTIRENITKNLREEKGWVYSPYTAIENHIVPNSHFILEIITDNQPKHTEVIKNETQKIISQLEKYPITNEQLDNYKKGIQLEIESIINQKDIYQISSFLMNTLKNQESFSNWEQANQILSEITISDLTSMLQNIRLVSVIAE